MLDSSYWIGFCGPHTQPVKRSRTVNTTIIATGWVAVAVATPPFVTATTQPQAPTAQCC
jgi:hypothetical protein